jgi:hypothetical protein
MLHKPASSVLRAGRHRPSQRLATEYFRRVSPEVQNRLTKLIAKIGIICTLAPIQLIGSVSVYDSL